MFKLYSSKPEFDRYLSQAKFQKRTDARKPIKPKHSVEVSIDIDQEKDSRLELEVQKLLEAKAPHIMFISNHNQTMFDEVIEE